MAPNVCRQLDVTAFEKFVYRHGKGFKGFTPELINALFATENA